MNIEYQPGDVVVQMMWGGWYRDVLVEDRCDHMDNGRPGFIGWRVEETPDGDLFQKERCWGNDHQVVRNLGPTVRNHDGDRIYAHSQ